MNEIGGLTNNTNTQGQQFDIVCMYVMYVMYVCMSCMYVCMYVCIYVSMYLSIYLSIYACHVCMYVSIVQLGLVVLHLCQRLAGDSTTTAYNYKTNNVSTRSTWSFPHLDQRLL